MKIDVVIPIKKRKYDVSVKRLQNCLRQHRKPAEQIASALDIPITQVQHWFRNDKWFAVPDKDIWWALKDYLGIQTDEFDAQITEWEELDCTYDMKNRIWYGDIAPTLTANSGNYLYLI